MKYKAFAIAYYNKGNELNSTNTDAYHNRRIAKEKNPMA